MTRYAVTRSRTYLDRRDSLIEAVCGSGVVLGFAAIFGWLLWQVYR